MAIFCDLYAIKISLLLKIGKKHRIIVFLENVFTKKQSRIRYKNTISVKFLSYQKLIPRADSILRSSVCESDALTNTLRKQRIRRKKYLYKNTISVKFLSYQKLIPRADSILRSFVCESGAFTSALRKQRCDAQKPILSVFKKIPFCKKPVLPPFPPGRKNRACHLG